MAKDTKKKKKSKIHVIYNSKVFLAPDSLLSTAAMHTKIKPCGEAQIRISDCNQTIKLWNNLNNPEEVKEMLTKIETMESELSKFKQEVLIKKTI